MLNAKITCADWHTKQLHGDDVGDVKLITGMAESIDGKKIPYQIVLKMQKKWERYGDIDSWCREYDLYVSDFNDIFSEFLRWPECYHAEINGDETQLWMEYIDGISGDDLTIEMLERIMTEMGRFQGRLYKQKPVSLQSISNLGKTEFMKNDYKQWNTQTTEYLYIRSNDCTIPEHLRRMLIDMDNEAEIIFENIKKLPVVLCHRDFWLENIFYSNGKSILIDWDTAGWGFMGEDVASLIADDTDIEYLDEYYRRFIPAYYKGVSEYLDISLIDNYYIREMILIKFGYRFIHRYMYSKSSDKKIQQINALQKIYEMKIC